MYRFLLRPKWIAFHIMIVAAVATMVWLSLWQWNRLQERKDFNDEVRTNSSQPVTPFVDVLTLGATTADIEWRVVTVEGTYLQGEQIAVVNRSQGGVAGRNVVDPLLLPDGTVTLINRGFVPGTDQAPPAPSGPVTITGRLRQSEQRRFGQPADEAGTDLVEVRRLDIELIGGQLDQPVQPMFVEQLEASPADAAVLQPIPAPTLGEGPHLSYALQWLIFAVCVIIGWVFAVRRSAATASGRVGRKRPGSPPPIADELSRVGDGTPRPSPR